MRKNKSLGFTIIELLIAIAIIGILTTVALTSLSNQRAKAKIASSQSTLSSILPIAIACMDDGDLFTDIGSLTGGGNICGDTSPVWPELTGGWEYDMDPNPPTSNTDLSTFSFSAADSLGNSVTCDETNGCVTVLASE